MNTYDDLKANPNFVLLDCISGSTAYNLSVEGSDVDRKGIFVAPQGSIYGFGSPVQLANATNDEVYFEIGRFIELLVKNNPNVLELLYTPAKHVLFRHPLMDLIDPREYLSKRCLETFAGYAVSQLKKAKGLNKKINIPQALERKTVLDFCYVLEGNGSTSLAKWLNKQGFHQEECGIAKVDHFRDVYLLYHRTQLDGETYFHGICSGASADDVHLSSIPKGLAYLAVMTFNKDGYSSYCREYREYKTWEENRNPERFAHNRSLGKDYDAKNMMHLFRLLHMAEEIALYGEMHVHRPDREFLLSIRNGSHTFDELSGMVNVKLEKLRQKYADSALQDYPDPVKAEKSLVRIRKEFYERVT